MGQTPAPPSATAAVQAATPAVQVQQVSRCFHPCRSLMLAVRQDGQVALQRTPD